MYFKPKMSFKRVCKELSAKIVVSLFSIFDTLKRATIHAYFGSCQLPWFQACGIFTNFGYFPITLKLSTSKESLKFLTTKLPVTLWIIQLYEKFIKSQNFTVRYFNSAIYYSSRCSNLAIYHNGVWH